MEVVPTEDDYDKYIIQITPSRNRTKVAAFPTCYSRQNQGNCKLERNYKINFYTLGGFKYVQNTMIFKRSK